MNVSKGCCFFSAHSFFVVKRNKSVEDTLLIFGHQEVTFDKLLLMTLYISCKQCRHQVSSTYCFQILRPSKNVFLFSSIGCVIFARWQNCVAEIFLGKKWITAVHCFAQRIISPTPATLSSPIYKPDLYGCWNDLRYQIKICWLLESPIKTRNTGIENVVEYSHSGSTHTDHLVAFEGSLGRQPSSAIHCLIASYTAAPVCKQSKKYKYSCSRKWKSLRSFRNFSGMIFAEMQKAADMALILDNKLNVVIN